MNFGEAAAILKGGGRVSRSGWNGKGMWLVLVKPDDDAQPPGGAAYSVVGLHGERTADRCLPWIGMRTAQGEFVPWLASQTDILADDWSAAERSET